MIEFDNDPHTRLKKQVYAYANICVRDGILDGIATYSDEIHDFFDEQLKIKGSSIHSFNEYALTLDQTGGVPVQVSAWFHSATLEALDERFAQARAKDREEKRVASIKYEFSNILNCGDFTEEQAHAIFDALTYLKDEGVL